MMTILSIYSSSFSSIILDAFRWSVLIFMHEGSGDWVYEIIQCRCGYFPCIVKQIVHMGAVCVIEFYDPKVYQCNGYSKNVNTMKHEKHKKTR
jgi:hypothetical protein